ncbi:MAG: hypothetical protein ACFFGZ_12890 [Candidatus Thorarchaeota archaeon]
MTQLDAIFHLGCKFGELSRQIEMAIETQSWRHCRVEIELSRVDEILKSILDELMRLDTSEIAEKTQNDVKVYLERLTEEKIEAEEEDEEEYETMISRIRTKIKKRKYKRKLKTDEVSDLDLNLKIWEDRIINELVRQSKKEILE